MSALQVLGRTCCEYPPEGFPSISISFVTAKKGTDFFPSPPSRRFQNFSLPPGYLDNRAGVVITPLPGAARYRLNPAVGPGSHPPQEVDGASVLHVVELGGYDQEIYVAPFIGLSPGPRAE